MLPHILRLSNYRNIVEKPTKDKHVTEKFITRNCNQANVCRRLESINMCVHVLDCVNANDGLKRIRRKWNYHKKFELTKPFVWFSSSVQLVPLTLVWCHVTLLHLPNWQKWMCEIRHMAAIIIIKQNDEQSFGMFVVSSLLKKGKILKRKTKNETNIFNWHGKFLHVRFKKSLLMA